MKKLAFLPVLFLATACGPVTHVDPELNELPTETPEENQTLPADDLVSYENTEYGFSLQLPSSWEGFMTAERELDWGSFGTANSIDFGFESVDESYPTDNGIVSLFNVSIYDHEQWAQLQEEGPKPSYLGETEDYVFGFSGSQDAPEELLDARADVSMVQEGFSILQ